MDISLLMRLSNADAIAAREHEVRALLREELDGCFDEIRYDGLGSILFHSLPSYQDKELLERSDRPAIRIMFAAHMDEVGFQVRSISDIGLINLIVVGGVIENCKNMQMVRITTQDGGKVEGILNMINDGAGAATDVFADVGCESYDEARACGISIGDMVTFSSHARKFNDHIVAGKAFDDRAGLFILAQAMKLLHASGHSCDLWFAATSSEEVGMRGGRTASAAIHPDIFFALDVASGSATDRSRINCRQIGKGPLLVYFDKTLCPSEKLLQFMRSCANDHGIPFQNDMFKGGGTDAGAAHLEGSGCPALVLGVPLRYCHGSWSLASTTDLQHAVDLVCASTSSLDRIAYDQIASFE